MADITRQYSSSKVFLWKLCNRLCFRRAYHKAERDFVLAKMTLFAKADLKEKLTEHLQYIITNSEMRKAEKLAELTEQFVSLKD